jgi:hypothetical protein
MQNFIPGDVGILKNGNVVLVRSVSESVIQGEEYLPHHIIEANPVLIQSTEYAPAEVAPVEDFSACWISPARLGFGSLNTGDQELNSLARELATTLGPNTKAVVDFRGQSITLVAVSPEGECASTAIGLLAPPPSFLRYVLEPELYANAQTPALQPNFDAWVADGKLEKGVTDAQMFHAFARGLFDETSRVFGKFHDYREWFTQETKLPNTQRIIAWANRTWLHPKTQAQAVQDSIGAIRTKHAVGGEGITILISATATRRAAEEFVTDYEDYLADSGLAPGRIAVEITQDNTLLVRQPTARFHLSTDVTDGIATVDRFLRTSAGRGFLEVDSLLALEDDDEITSGILDNEAPLLLVDGRGGSGKTTTLMRKAAADAGKGRRVAFIVASTSLKNRLRRLKRQIPSSGNLRKDFDIWSADLIGTATRPEATRHAANGVGRPGGGYIVRPDKLTRALTVGLIGQRIPYLITAHQIILTTELPKPEYDTVILDEAQDLWPQHWMIAIALLAQRGSDGAIVFPEGAQLRIAFDERQNMLHRESITNSMFFKISKTRFRALINQGRIEDAALGFKESMALARAANAKFFDKDEQVWYRQEAVFRQSISLAGYSDKLIRQFESENPDLYREPDAQLTLLSLQDRVSEPIRELTPKSLNELVESIVAHKADCQVGNTGPLAVALPDRSSRRDARHSGRPWLGGELCLRLFAAGMQLARTSNIAIGTAESVRRTAIGLAELGEAFGVKIDDFELRATEDSRIEFLYLRRDRRTPTETKGIDYAKVLKRLVESAITYRASGAGITLLGEPYTLKGFEFGTLISIPADIDKPNLQRDYAVATRPRWALFNVNREALNWRASDFTLPAMLIEANIEIIGQFPVFSSDLVRALADDQQSSLDVMTNALLAPFLEANQWERLLNPTIKSLLYIVTPAALNQLATTEAWRTHAPAGTTPEEIYGKNGSMSHLFNEPFATRADLQDALGQNHGGGVQMEVIEALATLCGPRLDGDAAQVESPL